MYVLPRQRPGDSGAENLCHSCDFCTHHLLRFDFASWHHEYFFPTESSPTRSFLISREGAGVSELALDEASSNGCTLATRIVSTSPSYIGAGSKQKDLDQYEGQRETMQWLYKFNVYGCRFDNFELQLTLTYLPLSYKKELNFYILPHPSKL